MPVDGFEPLEHIKVLTDFFDESPIPARVYLDSANGRIPRLIRGSDKIEELKIAEGVTTIAAYAFSGFEKLRKVVLPESIRYIEEGAFLKCRSLREINLPDGLRKIDHYAFGKTALDGYNLRVPETLVLGRDALPPPYQKGGKYPWKG